MRPRKGARRRTRRLPPPGARAASRPRLDFGNPPSEAAARWHHLPWGQPHRTGLVEREAGEIWVGRRATDPVWWQEPSVSITSLPWYIHFSLMGRQHLGNGAVAGLFSPCRRELRYVAVGSGPQRAWPPTDACFSARSLDIRLSCPPPPERSDQPRGQCLSGSRVAPLRRILAEVVGWLAIVHQVTRTGRTDADGFKGGTRKGYDREERQHLVNLLVGRHSLIQAANEQRQVHYGQSVV